MFSCKHFSQILCEIFATQYFFTDHLKRKTVEKTTFRTLSANPRQLRAHYSKSFPTALITFWCFQDFLIYLAKYF